MWVGALPGIDFRKEAVLLLTDAQAKDILPDSMVPLVTQVLEKTVANPYLLLIPKTRKLGFVPVEFAGAEVSLESTLDFSYVNWCFIRMASAMGNANAVQATRPYVTAYQWLLDGKQGYARPRNEDLLFYNGKDSLAHKDALLYVPHNMEDVVDRARRQEGSTEKDWTKQNRLLNCRTCMYGPPLHGKDKSRSGK